jgi:hypothetical protein
MEGYSEICLVAHKVRSSERSAPPEGAVSGCVGVHIDVNVSCYRQLDH